LNSFTFGESILNDAVAIVIFRSFMQLYHEAAVNFIFLSFFWLLIIKM
jgi:NhaP-type Na+/H+ or K+/H+ antiporter